MSRFAIIIRPAVHGRNLAWPVAMDVFYRSSPLQCICSPWILDSFFTFPDRTEEIDQESYLSQGCNDGCPGNQQVDRNPFLHERKLRKRIVTTWNPVHSHKVHREKYQIRSQESQPKMQI